MAVAKWLNAYMAVYFTKRPTPNAKCLPRKNNILLLDKLTQVDQSITHTPKGCIDAHIGLLCDILETHVRIMAHEKDFFLFLR